MDLVSTTLSNILIDPTLGVKRIYVPRVNYGGNFCGHIPDAPRFNLERPANKGRGGIPRVLTLLHERLTQYYHSPGTLPSLNLANDSVRQQRSERREACLLVMGSLLRRTELASLRVGQPTKDGFVNYRMEVVLRDTGLTMRRIERAIRDLKTAGIVSIKQPRQVDEHGEWKGLAAVKTITKHLFAVFGLKVALELEQKKAVKRLKQKANGWNREDGKKRTIGDVARFKLLTRKMTMPIPKTPPINKITKPQKGYNEEYERERQLRAIDIRIAHPDWSKEECYKEAERGLQGRLWA